MNEDLLKVIAGLECCTAMIDSCSMCPYDNGEWDNISCLDKLDHDALRILREVEQDGLY